MATPVEWRYLIIWEFRVRAGMEALFEEVYGPQGDWARFFARGKGFVRTELNHDLKDSRRYLTLDFWVSREAYENFRRLHAPEYGEQAEGHRGGRGRRPNHRLADPRQGPRRHRRRRRRLPDRRRRDRQDQHRHQQGAHRGHGGERGASRHPGRPAAAARR